MTAITVEHHMSKVQLLMILNNLVSWSFQPLWVLAVPVGISANQVNVVENAVINNSYLGVKSYIGHHFQLSRLNW